MSAQQTEPIDRRLPLAVTETEAAMIEAWRHKHMMPSRNEALRWLIRLGLKAKLGLPIIAAIVLSAAPGAAQSINRMYQLCRIEDPSCVPIIAQLFVDGAMHPDPLTCLPETVSDKDQTLVIHEFLLNISEMAHISPLALGAEWDAAKVMRRSLQHIFACR